MQCKKCGTDYNETEIFCSNCGEPVSNNNVVEENVGELVVNNELVNNIDESTNNLSDLNNSISSENSVEIPSVNENNEENSAQIESHETNSTPFVPEPVINSDNTSNVHEIKPKSSGKSIGIILLIVGVLAVIAVALIIILKGKKNNLTCTSNTGTIVIKFTNKKIVDYTSVDGISLDVDEYNKVIESMGVDEFINRYNRWFSTNKFGTCIINGEQLEPEDISTDTDNTSQNVETKEVGDKERGYVDVPSDWNNFVDVNGASALQFSYASVYIVSLDVVKESTYNAEQVAKSYLNSKKQDTSISNLQTSVVKIGKNNEYTAYQVSMFYPSVNSYLITYWFEAEDGNVHYIGLEGPEKLEENNVSISGFKSIPESFRLKTSQ